MKKWWYFMSDIMECNEDKSPKTIELKQVFSLNDNLNKLVIDLGKTNIKFVIINNRKIKFSTSLKHLKA